MHHLFPPTHTQHSPSSGKGKKTRKWQNEPNPPHLVIG